MTETAARPSGGLAILYVICSFGCEQLELFANTTFMNTSSCVCFFSYFLMLCQTKKISLTLLSHVNGLLFRLSVMLFCSECRIYQSRAVDFILLISVAPL